MNTINLRAGPYAPFIFFHYDLLQFPYVLHTKSCHIHALRHTCVEFHCPTDCTIVQQLNDSYHYRSPIGGARPMYT
jgi:hypothetical protein